MDFCSDGWGTAAGLVGTHHVRRVQTVRMDEVRSGCRTEGVGHEHQRHWGENVSWSMSWFLSFSLFCVLVLFFRPLGWGRKTELGGEMCGWDCGGVVGGRVWWGGVGGGS